MNLRFLKSKPSDTSAEMSYETLVSEIEKCLQIIKETVLHLGQASSITISSTKLTEEICENHIKKLCLIKPELVSVSDNTNLLKLALSINQKKQHIQESFQRHNNLSVENNRLLHQQLLSINLTPIIDNLLVTSVDLTNLNDIYIPALQFAITTNSVSTILFILSKNELDEVSAETCLQFAINYRTERNEPLPLSLVKLFNIHSPAPKTTEQLWNRFPDIIINYPSQSRAYIIHMIETITPDTPTHSDKGHLYSLNSCLFNLRLLDVSAPQIWAEPINSNNTSLFIYAINNACNIRLINHLFSLKNKPKIYLNASNPEDPLLIALHHKRYHTATLVLKSFKFSESDKNEHLDTYINKAIEVGCDFNLIEHLLSFYNPPRNITDLIKEKFTTPASLSQQFDYDHSHHNGQILSYVITNKFDNRVRKLTILEIMTLQGNCAAIRCLVEAGADVKHVSLTFSDAHDRISANTNQMSLLSLGLSTLLYIINHKLLIDYSVDVVTDYLESFQFLESHGATWSGSDALAILGLTKENFMCNNENVRERERIYNEIKVVIQRSINISNRMYSEIYCEQIMRYRKGKLSFADLNEKLETLVSTNIDYNYVLPKHTDTPGLTMLGALLDLLIFTLRGFISNNLQSSAYPASPIPLIPIFIKKIEALLNKTDLNIFSQHAGFINYINAKEAISSTISRDDYGNPKNCSGVLFDQIDKQTQKIDATISILLRNTHEKYVTQLKNELTSNPSSYFYSHYNNHLLPDDVRINFLVPMLLDGRAQPLFVITEKANALSTSTTSRAAAAPR